MKNRPILLFASIVIIILLAWHFSHAQTFWNGGYPCGQAISLNGTDQDLSIADDAGSLDQTLDVGSNDFMTSISYYLTGPGGTLFCKGNAYEGNGYGYQIGLSNVDQKLFTRVNTGQTIPIANKAAIAAPMNVWQNGCCVFDRSGNVYLFINGVYSAAASISAYSASVSNTSTFYIGNLNDTGYLFPGYLDTPRFGLFGLNGLYVTGTGENNLVIKIGSSSGPVLYSEVAGDGGSVAAPVGLIPLMYKSPSASLTQLGFASIDQAVRTNKHDGAGNVTGLTIGNWYFFDQGTVGHDLSGCGTLSADGVFAATATTGAISSGDANDTVRRIGCVAEWNLNNVLTDGSGNGLTLTNNGSTPFVTSKIEALGSVLRSDGSIVIHRSVQ